MTNNHRSQQILKDFQKPLSDNKIDYVTWTLCSLLSFAVGIIVALS